MLTIILNKPLSATEAYKCNSGQIALDGNLFLIPQGNYSSHLDNNLSERNRLHPVDPIIHIGNTGTGSKHLRRYY